jgi:hypothetical protein
MKKEWNVLVYMAGDNNLTEEMVWGLQEMKKSGSIPIEGGGKLGDRVNVLAQYDPRGANPRRYDFTTKWDDERKNDGNLRDCELEELSQRDLETLVQESEEYDAFIAKLTESVPNMSVETIRKVKKQLLQEGLLEFSSQVMVEDFIKGEYEYLKKKKLLADQYLVILSGHGSGAVGDFLPDDDPKSSLSIPKLRRALKVAYEVRNENEGRNKKIDILGMESCMMSMAEVCYELRGYVEYLVGAEGFIKNTGWPYHRVLEAVAEALGSKEGAKLMAKRIVQKYIEFYRDYEIAGVSVDLAAVHSGEFGDAEESPGRPLDELNLPSLIKYLTSRLTPALRDHLADDEEFHELAAPKTSGYEAARSLRDAILLAHWYAQSYKREQYVDLYDFCSQLSRFLNMEIVGRDGEDHQILEDVRDCCDAINKKIESVVLLSCHCGAKFQHSHGLSIYFPWTASRYVPEYGKLQFAEDTGWAEFLQVYLLATLRLRRCQAKRAIDQEFEEPQRFGVPRGIAFLLNEAERKSEIKDSELGTDMDSELGTDMDSELGTDMASKLGIASMKNPPDGFYATKCPKRECD